MLPDIRVLNELKALQLASADVAVGGMWVAEDDGVFNPRTAKLGARKILIASSTDAIKPLQTGANFQLADFMVNDLKASIRKILMADQLQPQDGPAMTATEVHVRVEMIRQLLGPIYGRLQAEYLRPLIERCFGIAYRAGILGEPPESLAGRDYSVRYVSPMARAQRLEEVTATQRLYETAGLIAKSRAVTWPSLIGSTMTRRLRSRQTAWAYRARSCSATPRCRPSWMRARRQLSRPSSSRWASRPSPCLPGTDPAGGSRMSERAPK
ncbi:hypothetical protein SNK04_014297 [Fusarium graminearum]